MPIHYIDAATSGNTIVHLAPGIIAADYAAQHLQGIDWREVTEAEAVILHQPSPEEQQAALLAAFTSAIQAHLDNFAQTRNYDGILSAATYATSTIPKFAAEGQYAVEARDATWATGYQIMDDVLGGKRPMPTPEAVLAELPSLVWPEVTL